jgi:hypothetical protein
MTTIQPLDNEHSHGQKLHPTYSSWSSPVGSKILGLRRSTFFLLCALVVVIAAVAIGSGVGASMAVSKAKRDCSSGATTTSGSASSYLSLSPTTVPWGLPTASVALPDCTKSTYTSILAGSTFNIFCHSDNNGGDILWILTSTFDLCIEACGAWQAQPQGSHSNITCAGVVWFPTWSNGRTDHLGSYDGKPVNCILKNDMRNQAPLNYSYAAISS